MKLTNLKITPKRGIGRSIPKPLNQLGASMQVLADGKLDGEIPGLGRGDEVGAMVRAA